MKDYHLAVILLAALETGWVVFVLYVLPWLTYQWGTKKQVRPVLGDERTCQLGTSFATRGDG
jgi:hypothetical protein